MLNSPRSRNPQAWSNFSTVKHISKQNIELFCWIHFLSTQFELLNQFVSKKFNSMDQMNVYQLSELIAMTYFDRCQLNHMISLMDLYYFQRDSHRFVLFFGRSTLICVRLFTYLDDVLSKYSIQAYSDTCNAHIWRVTM